MPSPTRGAHNNDLNGVSCASAATCTAAGYYSNSSFAIKTLTKSGIASGVTHNHPRPATPAAASQSR